MKIIQKLLRQYGEHGNDYSVLEIGDTLNDILDVLTEKKIIDAVEELKVEQPKVDQGAVQKKEEVIKFNKEGGHCVRSTSSGDMVYYVLNDEKHWIKNPETLQKLGFNFHSVKNITNAEFDKIKTGKPIDLREPKPLEVTKPKDGGFDKYNL